MVYCDLCQHSYKEPLSPIGKTMYSRLDKGYPNRLSCRARAPRSSQAADVGFARRRRPVPDSEGPVLFGISMHRASTGMMKRLWQQSEWNEQLQMRNNICMTFRLSCAHSTWTPHPFPPSRSCEPAASFRAHRHQPRAQGQGAAESCRPAHSPLSRSVRANPQRNDPLVTRAPSLIRGISDRERPVQSGCFPQAHPAPARRHQPSVLKGSAGRCVHADAASVGTAPGVPALGSGERNTQMALGSACTDPHDLFTASASRW